MAKVEHKKQTLTTYPGDEGFQADAEGFKKVAMPLLASTLQSMRKCIAAPLNKLENATFSLEQGVQEKFSQLFGQTGAGDSGGASEGGEGGQYSEG